jgi:hypothetical protein
MMVSLFFLTTLLALIPAWLLHRHPGFFSSRRPTDSKARIISLIKKEVKPKVSYRLNAMSVDPIEAYYFNLRDIYLLQKVVGALGPRGEILSGEVWTVTPEVRHQCKFGAVMLRNNVLSEFGIDLETLLAHQKSLDH